jgi:hypothetical protein
VRDGRESYAIVRVRLDGRPADAASLSFPAQPGDAVTHTNLALPDISDI